MAKFSETMDPCFVGKNAAVLQHTRFAYRDQATRRRISNSATPKPGGYDKEWAKLDLAPMRMRGRAELPESSLILTSVKSELTVGGTLETRALLARFGYEEVKIVYGEEDLSAGRLVIPKFLERARSEAQGPSNSKEKPEGDDGQGGCRRSEEPMQQEPAQAEKEDNKASTGGVSSLDFNFLGDFESGADALETTEAADEGTSTLEPPSTYMETNRSLTESGSPSNEDTEQRLLMESPRRRRIEGAARVPFLGTSPKENREIYHRDHENRTGCGLDRVAFMEEVWTVVQSYVTQSILKLGLNRPLMREVLDKLDECEGRLSELLLDSATDEDEANSPIKMTPQKDKGEVVYLSRTRKGTMRS